MKMRTLVLASILSALALTGCVSSPNSAVPRISAEQGAAAVRVATSAGATLSLAKNPGYIPAAAAMAAGIDAALITSAEVSPQQIAVWVRALCTRYQVNQQETAVFINLATAAFNAYSTTFKEQTVKSTDPTFLLYAVAFRDGINDAIAAVGASRG